MKFKFHIFCSLITIVALSACSGQKDSASYVTHISAASILGSDATPVEKAEELAKGAEDLLTAQGLFQAMDLAQQALAIDSTNLRASFIKALIAPLVDQKGFMARIKPLADKSLEAKKTYDSFVKDLMAAPQASYFASLFEGEPDIRTEAQLQVETDKVIQDFDNLRIFTKNNKDKELTIKANALIAPDSMIQRYANACEIITTGSHEYDLVCPAPTVKTELILNRADFDSFQEMAIYYKVYLSLLNSYDLSGLTDESQAVMGKDEIKPQTIAEDLLKNPEFGRLRKEAKLGEVREAGLDLVLAIRWAMNNQKDLCPKGISDARNRVGKLQNMGMCVGPQFQPYVDMLDAFFNSKPTNIDAEKYGKVFSTQQTGIVFFDHPPADFRALGAFKIDNCSQIQSTSDTTFAGIFPKGDANVFMSVHDSECNR